MIAAALGKIGHLVLVLWHVAGLLLLVVLLTEWGVDGVRLLIRRLRHGRARLLTTAAVAQAHGDADWPVAYFDEFQRNMRVEWRPYVEWWQCPAQGEYINIDERGLRRTAGETTAPPNATRIVCFGGSTIFGMGARESWTIPAIVARRLEALGHAIAVTNHGQLGHNSTQELIALQQMLKSGARIDIALFYDGTNEMLTAEQTGRPDRLYNEHHRVAEFNLLREGHARDLFALALQTAIPRTLRRLQSLTGLHLSRRPTVEADTDLSQIDIPRLAAEVIDTYAGNLRIIRALAREYGFRPLFFWQPTLVTKRNKSADEQRSEALMTRDVAGRRQLYTAILAARRAHPGLAGASDAADLSTIFDDSAEAIYIDPFHLSEAGNAVVAEAMLPHLITMIGPGPERP
jgi:lysophospholipase L1-like esterase